MAQETEAAALLRSGNLFHRRVGLRSESNALAFVGIKHGAFAIYFDDEPYYHFDLEGRWQRAFVDATHFRKALDGSVDALDRVREGGSMVLRRRRLSVAETNELDTAVRQAVQGLAAELEAGGREVVPPPDGRNPIRQDELQELFARVLRWDTATWFSQRELHFEAYTPIGLLPPDAHNCLVLQATIGDASGRPFGNASPQVHDVRDLERFHQHVRVVTTLLGRRLAQCRAVFLGGPDVLRQPVEMTLDWFDTIRRTLPLQPKTSAKPTGERPEDDVRLAGIDAFLNEFAPPLPDRAGWSRLKQQGLGRVNLGIESGDPTVRSLYGRSWTDDDLRSLVTDLKAEAIPLGLMVLVGAGGDEHAEGHLAATADLVDSLPLDQADVVYLIGASACGDASLGDQVHPLSAEAAEAQCSALKERLDDLRERTGAKVIPYNPDKQWN